MLQPKRTKFRKMGRGKRRGAATTGNKVEFGEIGLKAMSPDWITARQIESARIAISRSLLRGGRTWIRIFPDKAVSKKTGGSAYGRREGGQRPLGCSGEAGTHHV